MNIILYLDMNYYIKMNFTCKGVDQEIFQILAISLENEELILGCRVNESANEL